MSAKCTLILYMMRFLFVLKLTPTSRPLLFSAFDARYRTKANKFAVTLFENFQHDSYSNSIVHQNTSIHHSLHTCAKRSWCEEYCNIHLKYNNDHTLLERITNNNIWMNYNNWLCIEANEQKTMLTESSLISKDT